jgi:hypothetical protein
MKPTTEKKQQIDDLTAIDLYPGLVVDWPQAHKYIQHLRREGWEVSPMPSGDNHRAFWCQKGEGEVIYVTFWREGVACIETEDFEDTGPRPEVPPEIDLTPPGMDSKDTGLPEAIKRVVRWNTRN